MTSNINKPVGSIQLNTNAGGLVKTSSNEDTSQKFSRFLGQAVGSVRDAINSVAGFIPGGAVLSAANNSIAGNIMGGLNANYYGGTGPFGGSATGGIPGQPMGGFNPAGSFGGMGGIGGMGPYGNNAMGVGGLGGGMPGMGGTGGAPTQEQLLMMQEQIQTRANTFMLMSNIMKVRGDMDKNAISNIR